jgi:hypothetical protein
MEKAKRSEFEDLMTALRQEGHQDNDGEAAIRRGYVIDDLAARGLIIDTGKRTPKGIIIWRRNPNIVDWDAALARIEGGAKALAALTLESQNLPTGE